MTLALGAKELPCELVLHEPDDRSAIKAPVRPGPGAGAGGRGPRGRRLHRGLASSGGTPPIAPLFPSDSARRAELNVFIDWFNRVWKRPPNLIADGEGDLALVAELRGSLDVFERMLAGRDFLYGADFGAADCIAFPFLKYGVLYDPDDDEPFHRVLIEHLALGGQHPRLARWIARVDALPRGCA